MIHICILTLNRPDKLKRCLESIRPAIRFKSESGEIVHLWVLMQGYAISPNELPVIPWLHPVHSRDNLGCAGGRKRLVRLAQQEDSDPNNIFVFLDDDLYAIPDNETWLNRLVFPIRMNEADITGVEGMRITSDFMTTPEPFNPDYVSGGWCAISGKVFDAGIMFDTDFNPNYYEDVWLGVQARVAGFRIKAVGDIGLVHEAHPSNAKDEVFLASRMTFIKKWSQHARG